MNNALKPYLVKIQSRFIVFLMEISCKLHVYNKAWHTVMVVFVYGLASAVVPVQAQIPFGL